MFKNPFPQKKLVKKCFPTFIRYTKSVKFFSTADLKILDFVFMRKKNWINLDPVDWNLEIASRNVHVKIDNLGKFDRVG